MVQLELDDIQGLVARGYGDLKAACYLLLEIGQPDSARAWLRDLAETIAAGSVKPTEQALNVAFTPSGFRKLGLPAESMATFATEFINGMTTTHTQRILGDVGESAPNNWIWGGPESRTVDILLLVFAKDRSTLATSFAALKRRLADGQLGELGRLETSDLDDREHFGFHDGISQPIIEGLSRKGSPANTVKAGEFILGYKNEYGQYTARPVLPRAADPRGLLPHDATGGDRVDLGRNGTYLVVRQLQQHVAAFWRFLDQETTNFDGDPNPPARLKLAAKLVGRWPSGAPLTLAPDSDIAELEHANDFAYHRTDPHGFSCPVGSHIRRTNPRDSLEPSPGTAKSVAINNRHRLLRRGREYGPPLPMNDPSTAVALDITEVTEIDRGLHFICLNANIGRQFEFVSHTWLNNPNFAGLYDDSDPLVASRSAYGCTFTVQARPVRQRFTGLPQFVTVRGGAYFFLPGLRAIRYLASLSDD